jgi:hypothetical protein
MTHPAVAPTICPHVWPTCTGKTLRMKTPRSSRQLASARHSALVAAGYDPGIRTGGFAVIRFDRHPIYIASRAWSSKSEDLSEILGGISLWLGNGDTEYSSVDFLAIEDQRWSRVPHSGVQGRTNAAASGPLMAQAVAMAWGSCSSGSVVLVQPMAVRRMVLGKASGFRCSFKGVPRKIVEKARREHTRRVEAATERAICAMVAGCPAGLTEHEYDAIATVVAGRSLLLKHGKLKP